MTLQPDSRQTEAQQHWAEGAKYAREGGRSLTLVNGAAAIGILTFVGNHPFHSHGIYRAMNMFAFGALLGAIFFAFAYMAQLQYGNRSLQITRAEKWAKLWHWCAYLSALASVLLFVWGMYTAGRSLSRG